MIAGAGTVGGVSLANRYGAAGSRYSAGGEGIDAKRVTVVELQAVFQCLVDAPRLKNPIWLDFQAFPNQVHTP